MKTKYIIGYCIAGVFLLIAIIMSFSLIAENVYSESIDCPANGEIIDGICYVEKTREPDFTYSCPAGYELYDDMCYYITATYPTITYTCPYGYYSAGVFCYKSGGIVSNRCGAWEREYGGMCYPILNAEQEYNCFLGELYNGMCYNITSNIQANVYYNCNSGETLKNGLCTSKVEYDLSMPELPQLPQMPQLPQVPQVPQVPQLPQLPQLPKLS